MFTEQHRFSAQNRVGFLEYIVSDMQGEPAATFDMKLPTSGLLNLGFAAKNRSPDTFTAEINFLNLGKVGTLALVYRQCTYSHNLRSKNIMPRF